MCDPAKKKIKKDSMKVFSFLGILYSVDTVVQFIQQTSIHIDKPVTMSNGERAEHLSPPTIAEL